ncbi:unnamed protein product [Anisakis simplex]|uniref:Sulfurtransferase FdhD n=1 Tax=Anisakis simplex TaxID=6269 RepID=A0A0M3K8Z6_ANISI|nr:unnamed protein product [Anisakis simplex]
MDLVGASAVCASTDGTQVDLKTVELRSADVDFAALIFGRERLGIKNLSESTFRFCENVEESALIMCQ